MVTYEQTKVTKMTVVFIARDSVDIFKVYGETVANLGFIASVKWNRFKLLQVALNPKVTVTYSPRVGLNCVIFCCWFMLDGRINELNQGFGCVTVHSEMEAF